ncbi:MAG: methyltransferase domain-containing protein [Magnetococcales bacterium]|nr:methyltransferase domain-containing protein [Magnetococcales bacterium]
MTVLVDSKAMISACILCGKPKSTTFAYPKESQSELFISLEAAHCVGCDFGWVVNKIGHERLVEYYSREYPLFAGRSQKPPPSGYFPKIDLPPDPARDWLKWLIETKEPEYAHSFDHMHKPHRQMRHLCLAAATFRQLHDPPPTTLLDIGTGFGNCLYLAKTFFWPDINLLAHEPDETMAPYLNHIGARRIDLKKIQTASVEMVFSSQSLEHLEADEALEVMGEIKRILKPRGVLSLEVPNVSFKKHAGFLEMNHEPHLLFFSIRALKKLVEKCGLKIHLLETNSPIPEMFGITKLKKFREKLSHGARVGSRTLKFKKQSWRIHPNGGSILAICSKQ